MVKEYGPMDIDYRVRCERSVILHGMECTVIRYGVTAEYMDGDSNRLNPHRDLTESYKGLLHGGRRPGNPIEDEWKHRKHYFNKRIRTHEEVNAEQAVQGRGHVGVVGALYGEGSAGGTQEAGAKAEGAGGGDTGAEGRLDGQEGRDAVDDTTGKARRRYWYFEKNDALFVTFGGSKPFSEAEEVDEDEYNRIKKMQQEGLR